MHLTVEKPANVPLSQIRILKNHQPLAPAKNIVIHATSPTSIDMKFSPVELTDQGYYSISVRDQVQPIMQLNVREKPIQRQIMNLPQDTFLESETLTIECKFDVKPDTPFVWTKDGSILMNDSRISIKQKNEAFILVIKDLQLSDQGVYSLESKYLILDTPFITILPKPQPPVVEVEQEETIITFQVSTFIVGLSISIGGFVFSRMSPLLTPKIKPKRSSLLNNRGRRFPRRRPRSKPMRRLRPPPRSKDSNSPPFKPARRPHNPNRSPCKPRYVAPTLRHRYPPCFQTTVVTEQPIEVKTSTVEETVPQPTVTIVEQPQVEEDQTITATTEVEQQPVLQVTADASSTEPKSEEKVSVARVRLCAVLSRHRANRVAPLHALSRTTIR